MTKISLLISLFLFVSVGKLKCQTYQSYGQLEQQLTKDILSHSDSMAFRLQAEQKIRFLINTSNLYKLYSDTLTTVKNLEYVRISAENLFLQDSSLIPQPPQIDSVLSQLSNCNKIDYRKIEWSESQQHLGIANIINCDLLIPVFVIKEDKHFGSNSSKVWQVYLGYPTINRSE